MASYGQRPQASSIGATFGTSFGGGLDSQNLLPRDDSQVQNAAAPVGNSIPLPDVVMEDQEDDLLAEEEEECAPTPKAKSKAKSKGKAAPPKTPAKSKAKAKSKPTPKSKAQPKAKPSKKVAKN